MSTAIALKELGVTDAVVAAGKRLQAALGTKMDIVAPIFQKAFQVKAVHEFIQTPGVKERVTWLAGNPAGFVTDKDSKDERYDDKTVIACATEALTCGVAMTGNEFNIIHGRMMIVRNGWERLCREWQDERGSKISSLEIEIEDIALDGMNRKCRGVIRYAVESTETGETKSSEFRRNVMLTAKNGETADATSGKAERRLFQQFYRFLTGVDIQSHLDMEGGAEVSVTVVASDSADTLRPTEGKEKVAKPSRKAPAPAVEVEAVPVAQELPPPPTQEFEPATMRPDDEAQPPSVDEEF